MEMARKRSFLENAFGLLKQTVSEWLEDKVPQLGAALAYYTVFSLAPLILVLLALVGLIFKNDPAGAWSKVTEQMSYFLDKSGMAVVQNIAQTAAEPGKGMMATTVGVLLAVFGASGVFGQLQDALNTIWGVKVKPGPGIGGFIRTRFLSFAMVGGVCFLLLVSLIFEALLKAFSHYVQAVLPGGIVIALTAYWIFDLAVITLLFAAIFKFLPDVEVQWRDVWIGAALTAILFAVGNGDSVSIWVVEAPRPLMASPVRSLRFCFGFIIRRKSSSSARNSPKCTPLPPAAPSYRTDVPFASSNILERIAIAPNVSVSISSTDLPGNRLFETLQG